MRLDTGLITGPCGLRKHLRTIGIYMGDPNCRLYGVEDESAAHIISNCEALATRRFDLFGNGPLLEETVWSKVPDKELLSLFRGWGLLD